jgi:predicted Zn-dependent peptidase
LKKKVLKSEKKKKKKSTSIGSDIFSLPSPKKAVKNFRSQSMLNKKYIPAEVIDESPEDVL